MRRKVFIPLWVVLLLAACAGPPPVLTPQARAAWQSTRVVKALDLLRDSAIDAEAQGLMTVDSTRKVVTWHRSALRVIQASGTGWKPAIVQTLDELQMSLSAGDRARLAAYFSLIKTLLSETTTQNCRPWPYPADRTGLPEVLVCNAGSLVEVSDAR